MKSKTVLFGLILMVGIAFMGCTSKISEQTSSEEISKSDPPTASAAIPSSKEYKSVIPFTLEDRNGNAVSVSDFEGKFVLINFWATWCTYCDQEMPDLQKLQDKYREDLVVLLVNVQESEALITPYFEKKNLSMLTVLDSKGSVAGDYGVTGMPASYFVTPDGRVIGYVQGMMSYDTMEKSMQYVRDEYEAIK